MTSYNGVNGNPSGNITFQGSDYRTLLLPGDYNGDGLLDIIPLMNTVQTRCGVWLGGENGLNFGNGNFGSDWSDYQREPKDGGGYIWVYDPKSLCLLGTSFTVETLDFDGDGRTDISVNAHDSDGNLGRYFLHSTGTDLVEEGGSIPFVDKRFGDFDGDGRTDAFENSSTAYTELSTGDGNFTPSGSYTAQGALAQSIVPPDFDGNGCSDVLYMNTSAIEMFCHAADSSISVYGYGWGTDWSIAFGDFNGDGKTDVFATKPGVSGTKAKLYLSTGTGFAAATDISGTNVNANDWGMYSVYTGDFNGDGKTDLLLVADGTSNPLHYETSSHKLWLSTGDGFVQAKNNSGNVVSIPYSSGDVADDYPGDHVNVRPVVADWNNDGASDVWIQKPSGDEQYYFSYTPEVIRSVTNNIGITTTVTYDRLNQNSPFYTKSADASGCTGLAPDVTPTLCTQNLDGPLYVVKEIDSSDGIGICNPPTQMGDCYSSTYAYAGAKADLMGRGFLGFSQQIITDSQTGIIQTTTYRTDFPYVGLVASQTKVCPLANCGTSQDVTISSVTNTYDNVRSGTANNYYYAVRLLTTISEANDIDAAISPMPTVETDYAYPVPSLNYWDATTVTVMTTPPGGSSPDLTKTTTNTFDNTMDTTHWLLSRLRTASVTSAYSPAGSTPSTITRSSSFQYNATSGLLTEEVVEPTGASNVKVTTDYQYDGYGNKITVTVDGADTPACATATQYDTVHHQFPVIVTNCASPTPQSENWGNLTSPGYDARFGLPTSHTGPNGLTTTWQYDSFGRKQQETRPDLTYTTIDYTYCNGVFGGVDGSCPTNGAFLVTAKTFGTNASKIAPTTRAYYDGLSRSLAADVEGFDGSWVRTSKLYWSNGRLAKTSRPYFWVGGTPVYTTFSYDDLGRVHKALQPDGGYSLTQYAGLTTTVTVHVIKGSTSTDQITTTVKYDIGAIKSVTDALDADDPGNHLTTYHVDAVGDLTKTTDPLGNRIVNTYDLRGRKIASSDPDMGTWTYSYDSLGRLTSQTDAKNQTVNISYDKLNRMTERDEPDMTSTWQYDTAANGIGKLASASCTGTACPTGGYTRTYTYDSKGRQSQVTIQIGTASYYSQPSYDSVSGKITTERSFSGYTTKNIYNATGYLSQIQDNSTGFVVWQANARDAELHLTSALAGNGVTTSQSFDPLSGRVETITAGLSGDTTHEVANLGYDWDTIGNLADRTDTHMQVWQQESFCYDKLNRVQYSNFGTGCTGGGHKTFSYDAIGNITAKDGNPYSYPASGTNSDQPHAVTSIIGTINGTNNPTFNYDNNGNMKDGAGRTVTYTSFNMASKVTNGANSLGLTYDPEHARIQQCDPNCSNPTTTTLYLNDTVGGAMTERVSSGGLSTTWRTYIVADGKLAVERFLPSTGSPSMRYFVLDHLGSVSVITQEDGTLATNGRLSYDAFGSMRKLDGTPDANCSKPPQSPSTRGYTSQEEMPSVCLVNYNARIYDPQLGRFMSADPSIEAPYNPQDLNRYTYVGNNPLSFNDPSGLCFLGCFWKNPIFVAVLSIAIAIFVPFAIAGFSFAVFTAGTLSSIAAMGLGGALAGAVSAGLTGGNVLQGALFGGLTAALMAGMAPALGRAFTPMFAALGKVAPFAGRFIGAGLVGGLMSSVEGGHFMSGFLAAGVGSLGGALGGGQFDAGKMFVSAALGGAASVLGGGKFANGAVTGAFAYAVSTKNVEDFVDQPFSTGKAADPSQYTTTPPARLAGLLSNSNVTAWEDDAEHSRGFNDPIVPQRYETDVWVYQSNTNPSDYLLVNTPSVPIKNAFGLYSELDPGTPPPVDGYTAVAYIHDHPFPLTGFIRSPGVPSVSDVNYVNAKNLAGIVLTHSDTYYFGNNVMGH